MKLTSREIEAKLKRIESYKERIKEIQASMGNEISGDHEIGYAFNSEQPIIQQQVQVYVNLIQKEQSDIMTAEIIDEMSMPEDVVTLGDIVTVMMGLKGTEPAAMEFILASEKLESYPGMAVSTDSPVGKAIYGKMVGDVVEYKAPQGIFQLTIVEKTKAYVR